MMKHPMKVGDHDVEHAKKVLFYLLTSEVPKTEKTAGIIILSEPVVDSRGLQGFPRPAKYIKFIFHVLCFVLV